MDEISLIQKIGGNTTPNDILEIENKVIKLVEERGVASFPYKNIIGFIVEYIKKETDAHREQTSGYQWEEGRSGAK